MSKVISIALAAMVFLQGVNMDMGDMVRINELLEHAAFHNEQYGDNFLVYGQPGHGQQNASQFNHINCVSVKSPFGGNGFSVMEGNRTLTP